MMNKKALTIAIAALAAVCLMGCSNIENGVYNDGQPAQTSQLAPQSEAVTTTEPITQPTEPVTTVAEATTPEESETSAPLANNVVIEPLDYVSEWDYNSLSTESNGYGQGTHYDELNRPRGALRFNEGYSKFRAKAINDTEEKVIMLTFDQGYENGFTGKILDTLKEKGVKATFFVVQDYAERQPELVQRMIDEGHTVGSHSWHHYSIPELSVEEATEEIMELHDYMLENFGICMNKFRPPKGEYSELSLAVTGDLGYETVLWSFAYADWDPDKQPEPTASLQKLIERAHPGAIYLLHSVSETNAEILGDFIDEMIAQGYSFAA